MNEKAFIQFKKECAQRAALKERVDKAKLTVAAYLQIVGREPSGSMEVDITTLVTDLLYLAADQGIDPRDVIYCAKKNAK